MTRLRQLVVFDRLLARVCDHLGDRVVVKGGLILELRLKRARTTKDVDLRMTGDASQTLSALRDAGRLDLGDYLSFVVERDAEHPTINANGMIYEGQRFRCEGRLAGKLYGNPFGIDVGFADAMTITPETVEGSSFLDFAEAPRAKLRIYPRPTHIAEKLHAYTLPRERENTRVKDLPDLALLASVGPLDGTELKKALNATFSFRNTHPLPTEAPLPPSAWEPVYARMAAEDDLPWKTLANAVDAVKSFLDPVLRGNVRVWVHDGWRWESDE